MEKLPKFFRKGMEKSGGQDKMLIEKTETSNLIDNWRRALAEKDIEKEKKKQSNPQNMKIKKKSVDSQIDFSKTIVDAVRTVTDSMKPNYGVGIIGNNLKMVII